MGAQDSITPGYDMADESAYLVVVAVPAVEMAGSGSGGGCDHPDLLGLGSSLDPVREPEHAQSGHCGELGADHCRSHSHAGPGHGA